VERALVAALVDCLAFIELSPDSVIDPDAAVQVHEQVAVRLQALPPEDRQRLVAHVAALLPRRRAAAPGVSAGPPEALGVTE
jgi:hypothetical protein